MAHETETLIIDGKAAQVDRNIIPIVNWLNSFDGVTTYACCEGDDWISDLQGLVPPYVAFYCTNETSLIEIIKLCSADHVRSDIIEGQDILCSPAYFEVDYYERVSYIMRIGDITMRNVIVERISQE